MKSIIIGNGINLQFSNKTYSNEFILKRAYLNSLTGIYTKYFNNTIQQKELEDMFKDFVKVAKLIFDDNLQHLNEELKLEIIEFKKRYPNKIKKYDEIIMEDWFLILHYVIEKNNDIKSQWSACEIGLKIIFLSAIYNNGQIEKIFENIPKNVVEYINGFDKIFTLNFDMNLDGIVKNDVYHLHGSFANLSKSKPDKIGFKEFSECNTILNYSGSRKLNSIDNMQMKKEYHFEKIEHLTGEVTIIGMSPNNDNHIFESINKSMIQKVFFYTYGNLNIQLPLTKEYKILNVKKLWGKLKVNKNEYRNQIYNKILTNKNQIIKFQKDLEPLLLEKDNIERVLKDVKLLDDSEIKRLVGRVENNINKESMDKEGIISIALEEGVLPTTLYFLYFEYRKNVK
ncbi:MAG: hypothetical protein R3Y64_09440 [Peptostreptococcaceae bacterium]